MPAIPPMLLKKLYVRGSLQATEEGFTLALKNTLAPAVISGFKGLKLNGQPVQLDGVSLLPPDEPARAAESVTPQAPLQFPLGATFTIRASGMTLSPGRHSLNITVEVQDVGKLDVPIQDRVA